ncbi:hypothetical protein GCM10010358_57810 [Streptomyces minutiscleroticus]|uniref:Uncharacterized protein n=1 Tax=Streptomyces minutiscleroticus TaxID=68238 RepID=A0A918U5L2_9ACTN|nr:hypothetical protein GCM10010358_57810 [Streptomyces minutiscleroticus]
MDGGLPGGHRVFSGGPVTDTAAGTAPLPEAVPHRPRRRTDTAREIDARVAPAARPAGGKRSPGRAGRRPAGGVRRTRRPLAALRGAAAKTGAGAIGTRRP